MALNQDVETMVAVFRSSGAVVLVIKNDGEIVIRVDNATGFYVNGSHKISVNNN